MGIEERKYRLTKDTQSSLIVLEYWNGVEWRVKSCANGCIHPQWPYPICHEDCPGFHINPIKKLDVTRAAMVTVVNLTCMPHPTEFTIEEGDPNV